LQVHHWTVQGRKALVRFWDFLLVPAGARGDPMMRMGVGLRWFGEAAEERGRELAAQQTHFALAFDAADFAAFGF
jgi:hypothetical protein